MKSAPFRHHEPTTTGEATALLAEFGDDAKVLAGGQSLLPMLALRLTSFGDLVDLNHVQGLDTIHHDAAGLTIGATVRQRAVERDPAIAAAVPLLGEAVPAIGHFQIRNRGTIGGSIAHADPASELPACAVALGATIELEGPDGARRIVEAREFFEGTWTTTLRADELLVAVHWPTAGPRAGSAVVEVARRHGDFAIAGAAVHVELDENDRVERVGFGLFGLDATPVPADEARAAVLGARSDELDVRGIGELAATTCSPSNDVHATAAQRRRIAAHVTSSALERALHCALAPREEAPRA